MTIKERIINYLKKRDLDIDRNVLIAVAEQAGYKRDAMYKALEDIEQTTANIGIWKDQKTKKTYCRWYEPNDLTLKVQESLDRGDNW